MQYVVIIEKTDNNYGAYVPDLPGCVAVAETQSEVKKWAADGVIKEVTSFGNKNSLRYQLIMSEESQISASFNDDIISIDIPFTIAQEWCESEQISMESSIANDGSLNILIEKDFVCLTPKAGEDESDIYPNPLSNQE